MMRNWWTLLLASLAVCALLLLPVSPAAERLGEGRYTANPVPGVERAASQLVRRLQLHHWADSLGSLAVAGAESGASLVVGSVTVDEAERGLDEAFARAAARALGGFPRADVALGRFQVEVHDGSPLDFGLRQGEFLLAGEADGRPYCVTVLAEPSEVRRAHALRRAGAQDQASAGLWPTLNQDASPSEVLGACWVVARYGVPGPHVAAWFSQGGAYLATSHRPFRAASVEDLAGRAPDALSAYMMRLYTGRLLSVRVQRCLAGDETACAALLSDPTPPAYLVGPIRRVPLEAAAVVVEHMELTASALPGVVDPAFLATLETRFGPERFRAFWTSDRPLSDAFADAFGLTPGAYVGQEARAALGPLTPGPGLRAGGWVGLALTILAGLAASFFVAGRRRPA
jgi:hypothetical protein